MCFFFYLINHHVTFSEVVDKAELNIKEWVNEKHTL